MLTELLTDLLAAVDTAASCEDFARSLVEYIASVMPCVAATFEEVDAEGALLISVSTGPGRVGAQAAAAPLAWARAHPVLDDAAAPVGSPVAISDLMSREAYRGSALYTEFHRELGVEDQLVVRVPGVALLIDRDTWGFSPGEHEQAAEIERMIRTVRRVRRSRDRARASAAISARLNDDAGRVVLLADGAGGLRTLDGTRAELADDLRTAIDAAVAVAKLQLGNDDDGQPLVEIQPRATTGPQLSVRVLRPCRGTSALPVVMERARRAVASDELRKYHLTDRQAETMALILGGATNGRVALELGISERTVEKHVVGAYERLGVHGRTEALLKLLGS